LPAALGLPEEHFIWLRNAGNVITSTASSTMRSLALACAVKGGREIAVIGHSDCRVGQTSMLQLTENFRALGVDRAKLPENLVEFFGVFASERQNVLKAVDFVRHSPLIGPKMPVHGLLLDIRAGKLEWLVNGYQTLEAAAAHFAAALPVQQPALANAFASPEPPAVEHKPAEPKPAEPGVHPVDWSKEVRLIEVPAHPPLPKAQPEKPAHPPMRVPPKIPPGSPIRRHRLQ
jgi:carbonic anhydrase